MSDEFAFSVIKYVHKDDRAFYSLNDDLIQIPMRYRFSDLSTYFDVHWHELTHWSGIYSGEGKVRRMEWDGSYALAELIAEMTTCFVAANLGLPNCDDLENHNRYLGSWLEAMESDPKWIIKASSMASKVCEFIPSFAEQESARSTARFQNGDTGISDASFDSVRQQSGRA